MSSIQTLSNTPDVIICGHPDDATLIKFLADGVSELGISIYWPEENTQVDVSQLIPKTKVFLVVLSEAALTLDSLKDDIALAYMANVTIFPASVTSYRKLNPCVDGGLRLMLSRIQWTFFLKPAHMEPNRENLLTSIQKCVNVDRPTSSSTTGEFNMLSGHFAAIQKHNTESTEPAEEDQQQPGQIENEEKLTGDFWARHFGSKTDVSFTVFKEKFNADYSKRITSSFGIDQKKRFENIMYKDIFVLKQVVSRSQYRKFIGVTTNTDNSPEKESTIKGYPDHFYDRLGAYVSCSVATRKVLGMESTVRMTAIQQLASFKTPVVVRQLKELTSDKDPNIQAVAALALAKTGINDEEIENLLIDLLSNKDRLVRESACLSLAHTNSVKAMKRVLHVWRNDPISHVRQAGELALSRMGLADAKEAMKVTKVLTQEVTALKEASKQSVKT